MNLSQFSTKILTSPFLEDKLAHPGLLDYSTQAEQLSLPTLPARDDCIAFGKKNLNKIKLNKLDDDRDRGHLLLFL